MADATKKDEALKNLEGYGDYQSKYTDDMSGLYDQIMNREKFSYDLNSDALYNQYKQQYVRQGKQAMMDTVGQASSLTGGYGNSYATTAGNQAYQNYLAQLNDKIPELYQLAYDQYQDEGDALTTKYGLVQDADATDYSRWQDKYSMLNDAYSRAYTDYRDAVSDEQWAADYALSAASAASSGGGGTPAASTPTASDKAQSTISSYNFNSLYQSNYNIAAKNGGGRKKNDDGTYSVLSAEESGKKAGQAAVQKQAYKLYENDEIDEDTYQSIMSYYENL